MNEKHYEVDVYFVGQVHPLTFTVVEDSDPRYKIQQSLDQGRFLLLEHDMINLNNVTRIQVVEA